MVTDRFRRYGAFNVKQTNKLNVPTVIISEVNQRFRELVNERQFMCNERELDSICTATKKNGVHKV